MIKKFIALLVLALMLLIPINVFADSNRIIDNANKLSEADKRELNVKLNDLSSKYDMDIIVYFSNDTSFGDDIVSEGCEFYDNNGYGYGEDHRGLLLIVNYEVGIFDVITTGPDVRNKYDGYIEDCYNAIQSSLGNNPYKAIEIFAEWVDTRFIYEGNEVNDNNEEVKNTDNTTRDLTVSGVTSLIVSGVTGFVLKGQLKTEKKKHGASNYMDKNSFNLTRFGDVFLYRTTTRRRINTNTNNHSGGGSHISHTSSSGISHGSGGGRRF